MLVIAGFLIGGYGGSQLTATFLLNQGLDKDARAVHLQVRALHHLQDGKVPEAIELLEAKLDDDLVLFDPQTPYEGLSEKTQEEIENAITRVRHYRDKHPRKSDRPHVDDMVRKLFEKTK